MRTFTILATIRHNRVTRTVRAFVQSESKEIAIRDYKRNSLYEAKCFQSITASPGRIEAGIKHFFNESTQEWEPCQ